MTDTIRERAREMDDLETSIVNWGCHCDALNGYYCGHHAITAELKRVVAAERDAAIEECCRDVCQFCAGVDPHIGKVIDLTESKEQPMGWLHYGHARYYLCNADAIRARVAQEKK